MTDGERQTEGLDDTLPRSGSTESQATLREGDLLLERFKLVRLVGRGGMGEVYEARDLRLHATVALKTVRSSSTATSELLDRLRREVQLARAVTHPNVCRVFDLHEGSGPDGTPVVFVTMEYLDGQTLADRLEHGPLPPKQAIPLLEQMAEGLAAIHAKGLVHRDFKPGNVMLVSDEGKLRAVVTDFGIARAARDSGAHGTAWIGTEEGAVIGSPAYMSPEQRQGSEVTARSDIHALALVACEVVSGKLPSESGTLAGVPRSWTSVLRRALDGDPERRPADPRELVATLEGGRRRRRLLEAAVAVGLLLAVAGAVVLSRRAAPSAGLDRRAIAILPLANLSGTPEDDYFGDGLAEDINTQLTKVRGLHVIGRGSTRPFKETNRTVKEIAAELGVGTLLEGSVRRAGGRMRITAQLIDARTNQQLWAETYDRDVRDVLDVQTDVASKVASALALRLSDAEGARLRRGVTSNPEAYDAYLHGIGKADQIFNNRMMRAAMKDFERAVALDPGYAQAHAQLGMEYILYGLFMRARDPSWVEKGRVEVTRALELEPELAVPHVALAQLVFSRHGGWSFDGAMQELARAQELEPDSTHLVRAAIFFHVGLEAQSIRELEAALKLNPGSKQVRLSMVYAYTYNGRWSDALAKAQELGVGTDEDGTQLGDLLRVGKAQEVLKLLSEVDPQGPFLPDPPDSGMALVWSLTGNTDAARFVARIYEDGYAPWGPGEGAHHDMHDLACLEAQLGHPEQAVAWLKNAAASGYPNYLAFSRDPLLDPIRSDPGFIQFMAELRTVWEKRMAAYP